uniref:Family with sequence similarity 117 member Aa n=1 Tax=Poecilia latipinna TaxID=48699 RepID=A0A3B3UGJ0_9TELE
MSGRSGGAPRGCSNLSLQPLRATVPFQLQRGSAPLCREPKAPPRPTIRRTLSLDTIVGPYLQGQWPREAEATAATCVNDKATQTPCSWTEETRGRRSVGGHKRSASWGSAEHLKEVAKLRHHLQKRSRNAPPSTVPMMPLNRLAPRLRRSVEGLSLELEEVFVSEKPDDEHEILDIPDGHRAPVPAQRCSSGSQSEPSPSLPSPSLSPPCSSSPRPNKTYSFQRVPPEGCERVRVCEEASACPDDQLLQPSCPDPNKVNFTPHGGSAFCPVSLLKPLLPSMDLLFRGLSVSPVTGCSGQASPTRHLGMQAEIL